MSDLALAAREIKAHSRAEPSSALDPCGTAGLPGKTIDLAQAHAGTLSGLLGGVKRFEGTSEHLVAHAATGVGHGYQDIFACSQIRDDPGADHHILCCYDQRAGVVHCVSSIGREVQNRGLELARINTAGPEIILRAHVDLHPFTNCLLTQECDI